MIPGFRNALSQIVPKWLQNRPGFRTGYNILYSFATQLDVFQEYIVEAGYGSFPGYSLGAVNQQLDPLSCLPYVAQGRGLIQGEAETPAAFASRLVGWLDTWTQAGADAILATEIQAYLGNTPSVTIVDRAGHWTTIAPNGTITKTTAPWNWDSVSDPSRQGWWSDLWIIVQPTEWAITGLTLASLVPLWGIAPVGTGHAVGHAARDAILGLVSRWKGAHAFLVSIIWSYDPTLFIPSNPTADGNYGRSYKVVAGNVVRSRTTSARYWFPVDGG